MVACLPGRVHSSGQPGLPWQGHSFHVLKHGPRSVCGAQVSRCSWRNRRRVPRGGWWGLLPRASLRIRFVSPRTMHGESKRTNGVNHSLFGAMKESVCVLAVESSLPASYQAVCVCVCGQDEGGQPLSLFSCGGRPARAIGPKFNGHNSKFQRVPWDLKGGELYLVTAKPWETVMDSGSCPNLQIV